MLMARPKVSVVMAVHNDELYLKKSLDSVLSQTMSNFELIVVDDCCTDSCAQILKDTSDKRVRVLRNNQKLGLTRSLNEGLPLARGRYIARLDSDDLASRDRLEFQCHLLDTSSADLVAGSCSVIDQEGKCLHIHALPANETILKWLMVFRNPIRHSTVMWRNTGILYNPNFVYSQDYEMWTRMNSIMISDRIVGAVRTHPAAISSAKTKEQEEFAALVTKSKAEDYLGRRIELSRALDLRCLCIHRHHLQHHRLENMSEETLEAVISDYLEILQRFVRKEKPEIEVLRSEAIRDMEGIVKAVPRFKRTVEQFI